MDQYKRTDGNPSLRRSVSTKVEGSNEIAQLKSEIILLKRQNERLLKKEKRLQVTDLDLWSYINRSKDFRLLPNSVRHVIDALVVLYS
jgi:hypothetical protein